MDDGKADVERGLLPGLELVSEHPGEPVVVRHHPAAWALLGCGNYAAVFADPARPDRVVKVYAPGRTGIDDERAVYARLGAHPAYSKCFGGGANYLILRRLHGTTMFDCLRLGLPIPAIAVADIDRALDDARARGLFPHDVHAKNVMIGEGGRGLVVDVSDFGHPVPCHRWDDIRRAYRWIYVPFLSWNQIPIPRFVLDGIRRAYRRLTGRAPRIS